MQAENVARTAIRHVLGVVSDGLHSCGQPLRSFLPPVAGKERPHDGLHTEFACCAGDPWVAEPVRRANHFCSTAGNVLQSGLALLEFASNGMRTKPEKIGMRLRVIADQVA